MKSNRLSMRRHTRNALIMSTIILPVGQLFSAETNHSILNIPVSLQHVQQQGKISGKVVDSDGQPLAGASIRLIESQKETLTDQDGNFTFSLTPGIYSLEVRYLSYEPVIKTGIVTQSGQVTQLQIDMASTPSALDEVVIVGYSSQKKANLTGSVATISSENIENRSVMNVSSSLAGLASGVQVSQGSARPGSDGATIRIRGTGTLSNANALVLIDGIIGSMDAVNPNDIESISVLKDAASAAIYGAQAANGVILITTKKGGNKAPQVNYSGILSLATPSNMPEFVTDYVRHMNLFNESRRNVGQGDLFSQQTIDKWKAAQQDPNGLTAEGIPNYVAYPNTDWGDAVFEHNLVQQHNLSITGGANNLNYNLSGRILDNPGVMENTGIKRYELRSNVDVQVNDWLKLGTQTFASTQSAEKANVSSVFNFLHQTSPGLYPRYDGRYGGASADEEPITLNNLLASLNSNGGRNQTSRFNTTVYGELKFWKGFSLESKINYQTRFNETTDFAIPLARWNFAKNTILAQASTPNQMSSSQGFNKDYSLTFDNVLRYQTTIADNHAISALAGYNEYSFNYTSFSASQRGLIDESVTNIGSAVEMASIGGDEYDRSMRSFFGRVNYAFADKYLVEANVRQDGSSRFGPQRRWGTFPSFSAGWRISEEPFMQSVKSYFPYLKIRGSWGKLGNDAAGNYDWQATYQGSNYAFGGSPVVGLRQSKIANNALGWEETTVSGLALEFATLQSRLSGELEYYNRQTNGILTAPPIYLTNGTIAAPTINAAGVRNRGVEINLNWHDRHGEFKYSLGANFAYNNNKVTRYKGTLSEGWTTINGENVYQSNLGDVSSGGRNRILEGHGINEYYVRHLYQGDGSYFNADGSVNIQGGPVNGMIRTPEDLAWVKAMQDAHYSFSPVNTLGAAQLYYGDFIYADLNNDGIYGNTYDLDFTGTRSEPKYVLGLTANFAWKGLDLSMIWSGALGMEYYWYASGYNSNVLGQGTGIARRIADDHYFFNEQDPNDAANNLNSAFPRLKSSDNINSVDSDNWLYNANYIKLRNLQVGYTFNKNTLSKLPVKNIRLYFTGENLLVFSPFPGLDPEIGSGVGYPTMRQFAVGLNMGF